MKYLLFGHPAGEPEGGANDFMGAFDSIEQAQEHKADNHYFERRHIATFDGNEMKVVKTGQLVYDKNAMSAIPPDAPFEWWD